MSSDAALVLGDRPMSQNEKLGFRCEDLSARHRLWGKNLAAVDLDFPLLEYHHERPVALIEFKYKTNTRLIDETHPSIRALKHLADAASIPLLLVRYFPSTWTFWISPGNDHARAITPVGGLELTEREFVTLLHNIRRAPVPQGLLETLKGSPSEEYGYVPEPIVLPEINSAGLGQTEPKESITD
jgi:hypothetical protein